MYHRRHKMKKKSIDHTQLLLLKLLFQPMVFLAGDVSGFPVRIQGQLHLLNAFALGCKLCPLGLQMVCGTAARAAAVDLGNQLVHLNGQCNLAAERFEYGLLQTVAADGMLRAGAAVLLFERRADIVIIVAMRLGNQFSVHCLAAVRAAKKAGVGLVVIGRPSEDGISLEDGIKYLEKNFSLAASDGHEKDDADDRPEQAGESCQTGSDLINTDHIAPEKADRNQPAPAQEDSVGSAVGENIKNEKIRQVFLIGTGPGDSSWLTGEAKKRLEACDLIVGASRCVRQLADFHKPVYEAYQPEKIAEYLDSHPEAGIICGAMSGDTGFYSAAEKLSTVLKKRGSYEVTIIPGISSVGYFFAKIRRPWDHVTLFSMHGQETNFASELKRTGRAFVLGGGTDFYGKICGQLEELGMQETKLFIGENLSLDGEQVLSGSLETFRERKAPPLAVLYAEWNGPLRPMSHGLSDEEFLRGKVPMTKMEVRAVSVSKLELTEQSVLYDVGAGTGSISVECAGLSDSVKVFAIEKNPEAVELLEQNFRKFALTNAKIIAGNAPEALNDLPAPTHVFIGGSGGKMEEVIALCLKKNPKTRFVVNLITPESLAAVLAAAKTLPVTEPELVTLTAARSKKAGNSHLMMGLNPVWIVSFEGKKQGEEHDEI